MLHNKSIDKRARIELLNKSILSTKSYGKDKIYIPGGKRENDETDAQALVSEIQEELTVQLDPNSLQYIGVFEAQAHGHPTEVLVKMTCYAGTLQASSKIEFFTWLNYSDRDKISAVDQLILTTPLHKVFIQRINLSFKLRKCLLLCAHNNDQIIN